MFKLIFILFNTCLFLYYFKNMWKLRYSKFFTFSLLCIYVILKSLIVSENPYYNFIFSFTTYFIIAITLFKCTFLKCLLNTFFFFCLSIISEDVSYLLIRLVIPIKISQLWEINIIYIIGNISSRILQLIVLKTFLNLRESKNEKHFDNKEFLEFLILPSSSILIILTLHPLVDKSNKGSFFLVLAIAGLLFSNLKLSKLYHDSIERERAYHEIELLKEKIKEKNNFYKEVKLRDQEIKKITHDINKNYRLLYQNVLDGNYSKVKSFLESFLHMKLLDRNKYTGVKCIDNILCFKTKLIKYNINVTYTGNSLNFFSINEIDFNIIFENIIDNAIESCVNSDSRNIHIILTHSESMNIIKVINDCVEVKEDNGVYISTKSDKLNHGFGITIIKNQVEKHDGHVIFKYNKVFKKFEITVFLPVVKN